MVVVIFGMLTHPKLLDGFNYESKYEEIGRRSFGHAHWFVALQG
jgi:hypothetical protein